MVLMKKKVKDCKEIYEPSKKLIKIAKDFQIQDTQAIDFESLIQTSKDYSSDKKWIDEVYKPYLLKCGGVEPITKARITQMNEDMEREQEKAFKEEMEGEIRQKQERLNEIIKGSTGETEGEKEAIVREITAYSPHTERFTISTLIAVALKINVINVSEKGQSKSRCTTELLDMLKIPYFEIRGHQTPKKFYNLLKQYNGHLIVLDESANLFRNIEILDNLLSALMKSWCYWGSDREEDKFKFNGTVVFNTNWMPNTPIMRAVADRTLFNYIKLKSEQIKEKILQSKDYKPNMEVWQNIKNNLFVKETELSEGFSTDIYEIIKNINPTSFRDKERFLSIGKFSTMMTGDLSLIKSFINFSNIDFIIAKDVKRSEKVKMIAKIKKVSERQARNIIKNKDG